MPDYSCFLDDAHVRKLIQSFQDAQLGHEFRLLSRSAEVGAVTVCQQFIDEAEVNSAADPL